MVIPHSCSTCEFVLTPKFGYDFDFPYTKKGELLTLPAISSQYCRYPLVSASTLSLKV